MCMSCPTHEALKSIVIKLYRPPLLQIVITMVPETYSSNTLILSARCTRHKTANLDGLTTKSDADLKRVNKCGVAHHVHEMDNPSNTSFNYKNRTMESDEKRKEGMKYEDNT